MNMAKRKPYEIKASTYQIEQKANETQLQYLQRLAHDADRRMLRLEALAKSGKPGFENVLNWSYAKAQLDIEHWTKGKGKRFETKPPTRQEDIIAKINDIKAFMSSASSTVGSITSTYKKTANTINERYGTSFTWQDIVSFYGSEKHKDWERVLGSSTALNTIAVIQKNEKKIVKAIEENKLRDLRIPVGNDEVLQDAVNQALKSNELNIKDLF